MSEKLTKEVLDQFRHPRMVFGERVVHHASEDHIEQQEMKVSRDTIIDYIMISEETMSIDQEGTAAGQSYLPYLGVNWWIVERAPTLPIGYSSAMALDNFHESNKGYMWPPTNAHLVDWWGQLRWRHTLPWIFNPIDTINLDFVCPLLPAAPLGPIYLDVSMNGVGAYTGLRRSYQTQDIVVPVQGALVAPVMVTAADPQRNANLGDETFFMQDVGISQPVIGRTAGVGGAWATADSRLLNHVRMRVTPSIGDSWSDVPVPLIFYGIHQTMPYRTAIYKPTGGPIFMYAGQSIVFHVFNFHPAIDINAQVCLAGRTAPGLGSIQ